MTTNPRGKYKRLRRKLFYKLTGRIKKGDYSTEMAKKYWQYAPSGLGKEKVNTEDLLKLGDEEIQSMINGSMQIREERNLLDIKRIENLIVSMNVKKILDFGCGIGADGVRFARDFDVEVTFSDIVESNVKLAARHSKIFNINSKAILLDNSEKFIFPEVYDMIFSNGVLHHIPNASGVVSNLRKYLKSDGLFVAMLYTPKGYTESGAKNLVEFRALSEGRMPRKANVYNPYSTFYDEKDAKELFAGFELIESYKTYNGLYGWYVFRRS